MAKAQETGPDSASNPQASSLHNGAQRPHYALALVFANILIDLQPLDHLPGDRLNFAGIDWRRRPHGDRHEEILDSRSGCLRSTRSRNSLRD